MWHDDEVEIAPLTAEMCEHFPLPEYIVHGVLAYGDIACVFGAPGAGKSLLALYMAHAISKGEPIAGIKTSKQRVLYIAYEDYDGIVRRVAALQRVNGTSDNLLVLGEIGNLYEEDEYGNSVSINRICKYVKEARISLVIIDTLSAAFYGLEENDNRSMNRVVERAKYLSRNAGVTVILVHHNTKSDGATPRGHGVLLGALDMALHVRQTADGIVEGKFTKIKNGDARKSLLFRIQAENVAPDFYDVPLTVPVCVEVCASGEDVGCNKPALAALRILDELRQSGPVSEREWLMACAAGRTVSNAGQPADRQRVVRRHAQNLKQQRVIAIVDGFVSRCER